MEVLVKVGLRSDIKLRGVKCYRAVTFKEATRLLRKFSEISYIVLEDIDESNVDDIEYFLSNYREKVIVYNRFEDSIESIKEKLNIDEVQYASNLQELSRIISGDVSSSSISMDTEAFQYDTDDYEDTTEVEEVPIQNNTVIYIKSRADITGEVEYEEVALSDTGIDYKGIIAEKDNLITSLNLVNKALENDIYRYKEQFRVLDDTSEVEVILGEKRRLAVATEKINNIQSELDEANAKIEKLNSISIELDRVQDRLKESEVELTQKEELITSLEEEIAIANDKSAEEELKSKILESLKEKAELERRIDVLTGDVDRLNGVIIEKENDAKEMQRVYSGVQSELEQERDKYKAIESELNNQMEEAEEVRVEYTTKVSQLNIQIESLKTKHLDSVAQYREKLNNADVKIQELEKENESIITKCDERIAKLNMIITENSSKIKGIEKEAESKYSNIIADLNMEIEVCKKQREEEVKKRAQIESTVKDLLKEKVRLREDLTKFRKAGMAVSNVVNTRDIDYRSSAKIIMVYGSGSYGVTSMAYAIAKSKNFKGKKVLFMDLDCVNPKADALLGVSPIIDNVSGIQDKLKCTSFGILLEYGTDKILQGGRAMLKNVSNVRTGAMIDYFSGCYTGVNAEEMNSVNFDKLFTTYGNVYDYIIVDAGKIGNELSNSLILRVGKIASHKIIVTLNTSEDVRGMSIKLLQLGIDKKNTKWILNLAHSEKVNDTIKKNIGSIEYKVLPMDANIYGTSMSLDKSSIIRDRVLDITDTIK